MPGPCLQGFTIQWLWQAAPDHPYLLGRTSKDSFYKWSYGASLDTQTHPCSAAYISEMSNMDCTGDIAFHSINDAMSRKLSFVAMVQNTKSGVSQVEFKLLLCHVLVGKLQGIPTLCSGPGT